MPTELHYEDWADELEELADVTTTLAAAAVAAWEAGPLVGGRASTLATVMDSTWRTSIAAADEARRLAEECRRRAAICAAWTDAVVGYERALAQHWDAVGLLAPGSEVPPAPVAPRRPAPWAEVSR